MTPTKNGVDLYLASHGMALRADVYEYPGLYVFRVTNTQFPLKDDPREYDFKILEYQDWFDAHQQFGTMLVFAHHCLCTERWRRTKEEMKVYG